MLINIILVTVAYVLVMVTIPFGFAITVISLIFNLRFKDLSCYFSDNATSLDQLGNTTMKYIFNILFLKGDYYSFGNVDETVSSCLGKNKQKGTLSYLGKKLDSCLDKFDKNHSIKSIEEKP